MVGSACFLVLEEQPVKVFSSEVLVSPSRAVNKGDKF
jgi:hypothetical protein